MSLGSLNIYRKFETALLIAGKYFYLCTLQNRILKVIRFTINLDLMF